MSTADAYDSSPLPGTAIEWTRVYRRGGKVAHLHSSGYRIACDDPAESVMPPPNDGSWLGTGSQDEYEKAASLRLCRTCFARREAGRIAER